MTKLLFTRPIPNIILLALIASLSACVTSPKQPAKPILEVAQPAPIQYESIFTYITAITTMTADAQKKEIVQLNQSLTADNKAEKAGILIRLKLAALYGLPSSRIREPAKAQALLDELLREPALENESRVYASLLRDYLADMAKLNAKVRDEQKRSDSLQTKLDAAQSKADSSQQRADNLQRKLDELKNIEKTMIDRGQGSAR